MINLFLCRLRNKNFYHKQSYSTETKRFECVYSFSFVKHISVLHRAKIYQGILSCLAIPTCGILDLLNVLSEHTFLATTYIGATGVIVLSAASLPFCDTIGRLYISQDNKHIKISSVDFWGKRKDKIVSSNDWIPLYDLPSKKLDMLYLTPTLLDGTKYKLFLKFGAVLNAKKMGEILE